MAVVTAGEADLTHTSFLVVDDKSHLREIASNALMRCRARDVKYAPDIDEALQMLKRPGAPIGGIMCDWDLEPRGGLDLVRAIRSGKYPRIARDLRVVILTAKPDAGAVKAAMALDVNGFAVTPLSVEKLVKTIGLAMQRGLTLRDPAQYAAVPLPPVGKAAERVAPPAMASSAP